MTRANDKLWRRTMSRQQINLFAVNHHGRSAPSHRGNRAGDAGMGAALRPLTHIRGRR